MGAERNQVGRSMTDLCVEAALTTPCQDPSDLLGLDLKVVPPEGFEG
jgi:hypothetical protein